MNSAVLKAARANAEVAGVEDDIYFKRRPVSVLEAPVDRPGVLIVNPPYGERLGVTEELKDVYRDFAHTLKNNFKGWTCWLLSGNAELTKAMFMKSSLKVPVYNGPIECRFLKYDIRP